MIATQLGQVTVLANAVLFIFCADSNIQQNLHGISLQQKALQTMKAHSSVEPRLYAALLLAETPRRGPNSLQLFFSCHVKVSEEAFAKQPLLGKNHLPHTDTISAVQQLT